MGDSINAACATGSEGCAPRAGVSAGEMVGSGGGTEVEVGSGSMVGIGVGDGAESPPHAVARAIKTTPNTNAILPTVIHLLVLLIVDRSVRHGLAHPQPLDIDSESNFGRSMRPEAKREQAGAWHTAGQVG
jgi:hypothetical protein